jgi:hypothetical protein
MVNDGLEDNDTEKNEIPSRWDVDSVAVFPRKIERSPHSSPEIPKLEEGSPLPPKLFYSLSAATTIAQCKDGDLLHYAGLGKIRLHTPVPRDVSLLAGDSLIGSWGQRDFQVELLELTELTCRKIEMHGFALEDRFFYGWRIEQGHAVRRLPVHQDKDAGGMGGAWGCFTESGMTPTRIGPKEVFVMSFDLDSFLKGIDPPTEPQISEQEDAPQRRADGSLPVPDEYISDELRWLKQAAIIFWGAPTVELDDKKTHPKNPIVSAWLQKDKRMTANLADAAASIIRPHFARTSKDKKSSLSDKKNKSG